jgi:hypothetical protein
MTIIITTPDPSTLTGPTIRTAISERPYKCPFTILVDSAEQHPFTFTGIRADSSRNYRPIQVATLAANLGRHPNSLGDYSIQGFEGRIGLERKSLDDAVGTFLGWERNTEGGATRRERFIQELANLNSIECGAVIVEADFSQVWRAATETLKKPAEVNQQSLRNQIRAWQQDFPSVQWLFCGGRQDAEEEAFRWCWRFWEKRKREINKGGK